MKAITFQSPERVAFEEVPDPTLRSEGSVIVEIHVAGVCGSDLHVYHGREQGLDQGTVLGHEFVGRISSKGPSVQAFREGDWVVAPFTTNCGHCFYCRKKETARCENGQLFGWVENGEGLHGAQAEFIEVPHADATLVPLPQGLPLELAMFAGDVLPTGMFAAQSAQVNEAATAVVIGCGPVGTMAVLACRQLGARKILALDSVPERLSFVAGLGATPVDIRKADAVDFVRSQTEGRGADSVIEAVGSPAATRLAFECLRPCGALAAVGVHTEESLAFSPGEAYDKNITYRAGRCPARRYLPKALELLQQHQDTLLPLVSHRLPLQQGARAYDLFARKLDGCTKAVLTRT